MACHVSPPGARSQERRGEDGARRDGRRSRWVVPDRLECTLTAPADLVAVIDMARREAMCRPFLAFTAEVGADHLVLVVGM